MAKSSDIRDYVAKHAGATPAQVGEALGLSVKNVRGLIFSMLKHGSVVREGDGYAIMQGWRSQSGRRSRKRLPEKVGGFRAEARAARRAERSARKGAAAAVNPVAPSAMSMRDLARKYVNQSPVGSGAWCADHAHATLQVLGDALQRGSCSPETWHAFKAHEGAMLLLRKAG